MEDQKKREFLCRIDHHSMPNRVAFQCASVITGLKVSNLLTTASTQDAYLEKELMGTGLSCMKLAEDKGRSVFIVYREKELDQWLLKKSNRLLLKESGIEEKGVDRILSVVKERYQNYVKKEAPYPHEIGILLGYPAEDVKGFVTNKGRNYLGSGYWKVYSDLPEKKKLFLEFDRARMRIMKLIMTGIGLNDVIRLTAPGIT